MHATLLLFKIFGAAKSREQTQKQSELPQAIKIRPWMYVRRSIMNKKAAFCSPKENSSVAR